MKSYNRIIVVGRKRSGKTYWVKHGLIPFLRRYIIYDPDQHFTTKGKVVHTIEQFKAAMYKENKIIFQPDDEIVSDFKKCAPQFNKLGDLVNKMKHTKETVRRLVKSKYNDAGRFGGWN